MAQLLSSIQQIIKASQHFNCQIPFCSMEKCKYTDCNLNSLQELEGKGQLDKYWSDFLKAQQNSTANYLYKIKAFGYNEDPTLKKTIKLVPKEEIHERLLHMPIIGGLGRRDMFYLLSFLLNLMTVDSQTQKEYILLMLEKKLLDAEILNYLEMIALHPNSGLTSQQFTEFQQMLKNLKAKDSSNEIINYFNPEHIFLKSIENINPYELEYLKFILQSQTKLNSLETLYLAKFVQKLQETSKSKREQYLQFLRDKQILPFNRFETLIVFMISKAKRQNHNKLKQLLKELDILMNITTCDFPQKTEMLGTKKPSVKEIHIDYFKIHKALNHLMKSIIPNIVRLTDLKNFLKNLLLLNEDLITETLNGLKYFNVLTPERFKFIENFIQTGKLGKVNKAKLKELLQIIQKVATEPVKTEIVLNLNIPAGKGPKKENIEKDISTNKASEEVTKLLTDLPKKAEDTVELAAKETKNETKRKRSKMSAKSMKALKKSNKKPKKK